MKKRTLILFIILLFSWEVNPTVTLAGKMQVGEKQAEKPPMFVLQVGISRYLDALRLPELRGSLTDVEEMKRLLMSDRFAVPENNIRTLTDEQATKKQIFDEFEKHLIQSAHSYFNQTRRRDAIALFQFSGHGSQAPDRDGDETDKMDETLVTYDSQDAAGKNFDITDDEIFELTKRLNQYTDNIVYILDSCHSGSGTREAGDVRRILPRKTVPAPMLKLPTRGVESKPKDNEQTDLLPPGDDYIVISAARSEQLAQQKNIFVNEQSRTPDAVFGYLTFYLLEGLRGAKPDTSYDELMDEVRRKVESEKPTQTPQLEGDGRRYVFGGLSRRKDAGIKIFDVKNRQIFAQAGAMQGLSAGTILDIYNADEEKIGTAKISNVTADKSVAEIVSAQRDITVNDRAVFVSPDFGAIRLKVLLDGEDEAKLSPAENKMIQTLRENFTPQESIKPREVELVKGKWNDRAARWDAALLKDSFGKVFPDKTRAAPVEIGKDESGGSVYAKFPSEDRQIFYLAGRDFVPLYGFYVEADRDYTWQAIEKALLHLARLRSVKAIANEKSPLKGKITVTPFRFSLANPPCDARGKIITAGKSAAALNAAKTAYKFDQNEIFWLEITNNSKLDLYLAVLDIGNDGSVEILAPKKIDVEKDEGLKLPAGEKLVIPGETCRDGARKTSAPAGIETFKVIASTTPVNRKDFEFLEMPKINQRGEVKSLTGLADWTTAEINFEISAAQKPQP